MFLDLKTPFEVGASLRKWTRRSCFNHFIIQRALNQTKWKEYFSGGRKYYYNVCPLVIAEHTISDDVTKTETKESKWDMPDELLLLLEKVEKEGKAAQQSNNALV